MEPQMQETTKRTVKELNGVNLDALNSTIEGIKKNSELATFKFRAKNDWVSGAFNRTVIKPFYGAGKEYTDRKERFTIEADGPEVLLGTDKAADAVEFVLHALSACITTTIAYHAAARGITIKSLNSLMEGDLDLRGFLGLGDVRRGFKEIRITFNVETDAKEDVLRDLIKFSPVYEMISAGVPVKVDFKINKPVLS
ncbi:MAG: OsmC family protein [Bacteriovoracaceae bacterium]|nr:OsmC family protein [Bacteriovoracaceae bacterium]